MSKSRVSTASEKAGYLTRITDGSKQERTFVHLRNYALNLYKDKNIKENPALLKLDTRRAEVVPLEPSVYQRRNGFRVRAQPASSSRAGASAGSSSGDVVELDFIAESRDDAEAWLMYLSAAAVPNTWPGGMGLDKRPKPFLFSRVENGAARDAIHKMRDDKISRAEAAELREKCEKLESPVKRLPLLKGLPVWQQRGMLLQKLRLCSVVFDIPDTAAPPSAGGGDAPELAAAASAAAAAASSGAGGLLATAPGAAHAGGLVTRTSLEMRDMKRQTLLELVDYCDTATKAFSEYRVLDDTFAMIRCNLFRALPTAPEPSGDPDEEEEPFMDPQWPHLAVVYELLLHLVSLDHIDNAMKKKVIDPSFVRQLLQLFNSEDMRERDYLKTITHRIYSKLTQRRALIRRVICNIFFEFVYESQVHNGVAEMLEILASIINGFAVPIKDEHKVMLSRALLPLHKPPGVMAYHPQLSYCMALYVAKDHALTRQIVPGLLRYWPFGSSNKQIMFLNELDDVFEYVQEDDMEHFRRPLALRLSKALGGLHFQVAERTLCLWHSARFAALTLEHAPTRHELLPVIYPALHRNAKHHWHEAVRTLSAHILEQYSETDPELYQQCMHANEGDDGLDDETGGLGAIDRGPAQEERERLLRDRSNLADGLDGSAAADPGVAAGQDGGGGAYS